VVIQPWEYGSLPRKWVEAYRDTVDEFWVPSAFVRDCYVQSGIAADRVVVIPNGVDGNVFRPGVRPLSLSTRKRFKFLFVGGTLHRKGFDLLLEAYGKAFGNVDDVCLIVKDMGGPALYEGVNARDLIREFTADPSHPAVEYIDRTLREEEMPALYAAADCLVHPYRGEGFGLPIAEAMAAELPVIVTGEGAAVDFVSEETAFLLPARKGRLADRSIGGVETVDYPWLFEPDGEELVRLMRYVRTHKGEAKKKARAARRHVLAALSWEKAAELVVSRLEAIRQTPIRRHVAPAGGGETRREPMPMSSIQPDARVQAALRRAGELEEQGKLTEAEALFTTLGRTFPADQAVALAHTRFLLDTKQFEQASRLITETPMALKSDPAWLELTAICLEGTGEVGSAEACALKILERSPRSVRALTLCGRVLISRGDAEQAERRVREAIDADPAAGEPRALLGALLLQQGRTEEGLAMLEAGFQLLPGNGDILVTMVEAFRNAGRLSRAAELVEQAVRQHPRNKRLRCFLAEILAGLERPTESLQIVLGCLADFGVEDEALAFALNLRLAIGPMSVPPAQPKGTSVSACLIIKNEEQYLARCLWSILPVVHEIIIVDTGSTDRSEEIAAAFGAKISHAQWNNNFSEARNISVGAASGDWILVLDGDEVLASSDHEAFRALISRGGKPTAYSFVTRNYLIPMNVIGWTANDGKYAEEAGSGWIPSEKTRLFPRNERVRFENPVHELVEPSLQAAGIRVARAEIPVHHYGKLDATKTKEKAEVYLELGRKKLAEAGTDDIKAMFELAFQENDLGNYEEALRLYRRIWELNPSIPKVHFAIGANLGTLGRHEEAVPALERSIALDPKLKEAYVHLALSRLALGDHDGALAAAEELAALKIDYPPGATLLAATRFVCGDAGGGRMALQPLEQRGLSFLQYFIEFARHLRSAGRPEFAARLLEPFVAGEQTPQDLAMLLVDCYRDIAMANNLHEQHA
jgi:tetratricopeptide (TPR) repeat protein